uniref:CSON001565 protein n=1 Tax=Culicoides sonorensis TaxID=179676 RepID=A0A336LRQ1_CULSO
MENYSFDTTQWNFPNVIWIRNSNDEILLKVVTLIPVVIFGITGNSILLLIIAKNRSLRNMPTNILIANMAVADLVTLAICPLLFLFHDSYQNYILGAYGCRLEGFVQGAFLITSVINLCGISFDRISAIVMPLNMDSLRFTVTRAKIFAVLSWILGLGLALPLSIFRHFVVRQWKNFTEKFCAENVVILSVYWHVIIATLVWIPLSLMIISYTAIFLKLNYYEKQLLKRETPISVSYKKKISKTLFIVLVTFVLLRLPFTMLVFIREQKLQKSEMNQIDGTFYLLWYMAHYMIFVNAAVNPVIYGLMNGNFRRAFAQTKFCVSCHCNKNHDITTGNDHANVKVRFVFYEEPLHLTLEPREPCTGLECERTRQIFTVQ